MRRDNKLLRVSGSCMGIKYYMTTLYIYIYIYKPIRNQLHVVISCRSSKPRFHWKKPIRNQLRIVFSHISCMIFAESANRFSMEKTYSRQLCSPMEYRDLMKQQTAFPLEKTNSQPVANCVFPYIMHDLCRISKPLFHGRNQFATIVLSHGIS